MAAQHWQLQESALESPTTDLGKGTPETGSFSGEHEHKREHDHQPEAEPDIVDEDMPDAETLPDEKVGEPTAAEKGVSDTGTGALPNRRPEVPEVVKQEMTNAGALSDGPTRQTGQLGAEENVERQFTQVKDSIAVRHVGDPSSPAKGMDSTMYNAESHTPSVKPKARKPLQKQTSKQEVRCNHCSHTAFKDFSSRDEHITATHMHLFPRVFSFGGCTRTFGLKNEWMRHVS